MQGTSCLMHGPYACACCSFCALCPPHCFSGFDFVFKVMHLLFQCRFLLAHPCRSQRAWLLKQPWLPYAGRVLQLCLLKLVVKGSGLYHIGLLCSKARQCLQCCACSAVHSVLLTVDCICRACSAPEGCLIDRPVCAHRCCNQ